MRKEYEAKQEHLEKLVGQLTIEVDWLKKNLVSNESLETRKAMVELDNANITVKRQAELLSVNRTSVYRPTKEQRESEENVRLMHRIDEIYMKHPYYGYRRMTRILRDQGYVVNRKRIRRLMQVMGLEAIYPKPNLSKRLHATYTRPYLLRGLTIDRPNQVWGIDITYLRMGKGFMYLFLIIDWYSRKVIEYELSSTLEKGFVLKCLKRAFSRCKPEIMNSDQGFHFTNSDYLELLEKEGIKVSMDGKGRATDNSRTRNAHTNHWAKHGPCSSTIITSINSHPKHWKEDITYFSKNRVLTKGSITTPFFVTGMKGMLVKSHAYIIICFKRCRISYMIEVTRIICWD